MASTILWATGFNRNLPFTDVDVGGYFPGRDTTYYRTGVASARLFSSVTPAEWIRRRITGNPTDPACCVAMYARDFFDRNDGVPSMRLRRLDGTSYISFQWNGASHTIDLYIAGSLVAAGAVEIATNDWFQMQTEVTVDASGTVKCWLDGHLSIDYSGDTKGAGAAGVDYCYLWGGVYGLAIGYNVNYDDWVIATGQRVGDARIEELIPNGDGTVQWTRSAGSANYETVDETPESDADYNYAQSDGLYDELELTNWVPTDPVVGVGKTPLFAMAWARARVDVAMGQSLRVGVNSNGTVDQTLHPIFYASRVYEHIMQVDPADGQPWNEAKLNALKLRYEAEI